jgi:hypothetical protein
LLVLLLPLCVEAAFSKAHARNSQVENESSPQWPLGGTTAACRERAQMTPGVPDLTDEELQLCKKAFAQFDKDGASCSIFQLLLLLLLFLA